MDPVSTLKNFQHSGFPSTKKPQNHLILIKFDSLVASHIKALRKLIHDVFLVPTYILFVVYPFQAPPFPRGLPPSSFGPGMGNYHFSG